MPQDNSVHVAELHNPECLVVVGGLCGDGELSLLVGCCLYTPLVIVTATYILSQTHTQRQDKPKLEFFIILFIKVCVLSNITGPFRSTSRLTEAAF